jgi:hypothetical protein
MRWEVKSSNDRPDPRQEDWLNVLHHMATLESANLKIKVSTKRKAYKEA